MEDITKARRGHPTANELTEQSRRGSESDQSIGPDCIYNGDSIMIHCTHRTIAMSSLPKQRGQIFIIMALSLVALLGVLGLAVDSALAYLVKARLNAATDSAVVAGALATSNGNSEDERIANGIKAAKKFFKANYPDDYLGSSVKAKDPTITISGNGMITVDMNAQATMPVSFMRAMGFNLLKVNAAARTIRKDLDLAFVVDTSGSMHKVGNMVRPQVASFLDKLHPETDRVALVHFATGAVVDAPIGTKRGFDRDGKDGLKSKIDEYEFSGRTNSSEGFWQGWHQLNSIPANKRSTLRVVVFFSDGSPNTFSSSFKFSDPKCADRIGAIGTLDDDSPKFRKAFGLYLHTHQDKPDAAAPAGCFRKPGSSASDPGINPLLTSNALHTWYNAHGEGHDFRVVTSAGGKRTVTSNTSTPVHTWRNVNRASRNLAEDMAEQARKEGIYVFTLGLGELLLDTDGASDVVNDTGENLLKCMANTTDAPARCRRANQLTGAYCHAENPKELEPCFASLAAEILRITR